MYRPWKHVHDADNGEQGACPRVLSLGHYPVPRAVNDFSETDESTRSFQLRQLSVFPHTGNRTFSNRSEMAESWIVLKWTLHLRQRKMCWETTAIKANARKANAIKANARRANARKAMQRKLRQEITGKWWQKLDSKKGAGDWGNAIIMSVHLKSPFQTFDAFFCRCKQNVHWDVWPTS